MEKDEDIVDASLDPADEYLHGKKVLVSILIRESMSLRRFGLPLRRLMRKRVRFMLSSRSTNLSSPNLY